MISTFLSFFLLFLKTTVSLADLVLHYSKEIVSLPFICKVQPHLTVISRESMKKSPGPFVHQLVIDFLFPHQLPCLDVIETDEKGAQRTVFDETNYSRLLWCPVVRLTRKSHK